jgi:adenylylsulfate kinase-like enzyme
MENLPVVLITGLMASGKSTVAQALAERLLRSVHLRGDLFRRMIVRGQADLHFALTPEAEQQLHLRYRIAAQVARLYHQAGFAVVYQDIILGPALQTVVESLRGENLHVVVLCPAPEVIAAREAARPKKGYRNSAEITAFDRALRADTFRLGLWLDNGALTVAETVNAILARLPEAAV